MVLGGCLAMIFMVGIGSPATTEFFREIGANEFHFGLISGIPLVMLLMQFAGALALNRARRRKTVFIVCLLVFRLLYLGVAFLPAFLKDTAPGLVIPLVVLLLAVGAAAHNFAVPFWFSWMADLIPRKIMNRVWAWRQSAMHAVWTGAYLLVSLLLYVSDLPVTVIFPLLTVLAVMAGVSDILLFIGVAEPPNMVADNPGLWADLLAPLRHADYRRFVAFSCAWSFATMFAASFMLLYVLKEIGLAPWITALIWCGQGTGMALASRMWGRLADRYGNRPVLRTCVTFKPMIIIVFLLLTPQNALWLLPLALVPDGMLNAGNTLAINGYMLSIAPRVNRSMFIAAITGLSGLCGGVAAMLAGWLLTAASGWRSSGWYGNWNAYHLVFLVSLALRLACQLLVVRIREPGAGHSRQLLGAMMDEWPMWIIRFPVGLFRSYRRRQPRSGS